MCSTSGCAEARRLGSNAWVRKKGASRFTASIFRDRKSTRLNSSHLVISYAVFCLKKKKKSWLNLLINKYSCRHISITIIIDSQAATRIQLLILRTDANLATHQTTNLMRLLLPLI